MTKSKRSLADVLIRPILTEKATRLMAENKYVFEVQPRASKPLIRQAIEEMFGVHVTSVNTINPAPQKRRVGKFVGFKSRPKRAVVTLASGDSITLFPEV